MAEYDRRFWKNPDPNKKSLYLFISRIPFYLLIIIILEVYLTYMLTYLLPLMFNYYSLLSYDEHYNQVVAESEEQEVQYIGKNIVQFMKQYQESLNEYQLQGWIYFIVVHLLGGFFVWSLVKVVKTPPGDIPKDYQREENIQIYQDVDDYLGLNTLKDKYRETSVQAISAKVEYHNQTSGGPNQQSDTQQDEIDNSNQDYESDDVVLGENYSQQETHTQINPLLFKALEEEDREHIERIRDLHFRNLLKNAKVRHCKKCDEFKPDRTHHCSQCRKCVLKMDHHCQWVDNCLGFYNYKYFFVMLIYASIVLLFITFTYVRCYLDASITTEISIFEMIVICYGFYFTLILTGIVVAFTIFHIWLVANNKTTIEWCEKKEDSEKRKYDRGCFSNFTSVLNNNILLWLCPLNPNTNYDGLQFEVSDEYQREYKFDKNL